MKDYCYLKIQANCGHLKIFYKILDKNAANLLVQYHCGDIDTDRSPHWLHRDLIEFCDDQYIWDHRIRYKYDYC